MVLKDLVGILGNTYLFGCQLLQVKKKKRRKVRKRTRKLGASGNCRSSRVSHVIPIRIYPWMSTGLWDGAFQCIRIYRLGGERMDLHHFDITWQQQRQLLTFPFSTINIPLSMV
jgi:hypothetical protein